jgi:ribosomal protein S18 acetylase RimI-like enzyme
MTEKEIIIKEDTIESVLPVNATITEFDEPNTKAFFEERYGDRTKLILVAYVDDQPAGYLVSYDKDQDGSLYCWMTGVDPRFRRIGVLKKLMQSLFDWAKERGYQKITIKTRNKLKEMLAYLIGAGFDITEVQIMTSIEENRIFLEKTIN